MNRSFSRWALLPFLFLASVLLAVPVPTNNSRPAVDRKDFIPQNTYKPLPGKSVGVLALFKPGSTGASGRVVGAYHFSSDGGSCRVMLLPTENKGQGWNVPVGARGEIMRFENVEVAAPQLVVLHGIKDEYALVEVEVNGGLGSPANPVFVATKTRKLDGTKKFPIKVAEVVRTLESRYRDHVNENGRVIDIGMSKSAARYVGKRKENGFRRRQDLMYVTWLPESERLEVRFLTRISDSAELYPGYNSSRRPTYATAMRGRPLPAATAMAGYQPASGPQFGIEFGVVYVVSKEGKLERTLPLAVEPFFQQGGTAIQPGFQGQAGAVRTMAVIRRGAIPPPPPPPPPPK